MLLTDGSIQDGSKSSVPLQDLTRREVDPHSSELLTYTHALITGARNTKSGVNRDAPQLYAMYDSLRNSQYQCPSWVTGILFWKKETPTDLIIAQGLVDYDIFQLYGHLDLFALRSAHEYHHARKATLDVFLGKPGAAANQPDHDRINCFLKKLEQTPPPSFPLETQEKRDNCRKAIEEVLRELRGYQPFLKQYF